MRSGFPRNSWITSLRKENEVRAQKNHLVLDQQKIGFPITYQANGLTAFCIRNEGKKIDSRLLAEVLVCRSRGFRFLRARPPHQKRQRDQEKNDQPHPPESIHEPKHTTLQIDLC